MYGVLTYFMGMNIAVLLLAGFGMKLVTSLDTAFDTSSEMSADTQSLWTPEEARAAVFSERREKFPEGRATQAVELLRFISAYKAGVEALVDITPYSALLQAAADDDDELDFYAFIDTWVGNNSEVLKPIVSMKSQNGTCQPSTRSEPAWGSGIRDGNGFQVDINLIFWPELAGFVDTRPRASVTVSSGYYGAYSIGSISVNEGTLLNGGTFVQLEPSSDLTSAVEAEVYPCPQGKKDVEDGVKIGKLAKRAHQLKDNPEALHVVQADLYKELRDQAMGVVKITGSEPSKMEVEIEYDPKKMAVEVGMPAYYETSDIDFMDGNISGLEENKKDDASPHAVGQIIAAANGKAVVKMTAPCVPTEATHFLPRFKLPKKVGALERAHSLSTSIADALSTTGMVPVTYGPESEDEVDNAELLQEGSSHEHFFKPFLVCAQNKAFRPMQNIGRLALNFSDAMAKDCEQKPLALLQKRAVIRKHDNQGENHMMNATVYSKLPSPIILGGSVGNSAMALSNAKAAVGGTAPALKTLSPVAGGVKDGDKVCVLTKRATGRVFERTFAMPDLLKQDSVLLQFSSTGHGWSGSTEQCGEFCHAVYHFKINGQKALHVTEWRDDCGNNPISRQFGTWELSRDGWCPGSVEPGLYIDVTKWIKEGDNTFAVDVDVWSSKNRKYEAYTNYGGFFGGDGANLFIGASFFVYDKTAVDAIRKQRHEFTAAEKALVQGSSMPAALKPPREVRPDFGSFLQQSLTSEALEEMEAKQGFSSVKKQEAAKTNLLQQGRPRNRMEQEPSVHRYDFEEKAPWYLYNEAESGTPGECSDLDSTAESPCAVKVFNDNLIQINSREIFTKVKRDSLPSQWSQAAMHIRLETPVKAFEDSDIDHWDRLGSAGLLLKATTSKVKLHPALAPAVGSKIKLAL